MYLSITFLNFKIFFLDKVNFKKNFIIKYVNFNG